VDELDITQFDEHSLPPEEEDLSLDPEDWDAFVDACTDELRKLGQFLAGAGDRAAWSPVPDHVKRDIAEDIPFEPQGMARVCDDIGERVLPYLLGNTHPRFFGWVHGSGTAGGIVAAMYAAAMNANLGGREHAPVYVERTVVDWFRKLFGFPVGTSGILLSGTSMANAAALAVARNKYSPENVREEGLGGQPQKMIGYTSEQSHLSIAKAFEFLGLGRNQLRQIPVNDDFQIRVEVLRRQLADDRKAGYMPFCVVATAGTVNTAAVDDLGALAELCKKEDLWLHVDGAFGAMAILSNEYGSLLDGIERADSLAFDFHKWLHVPYDAGCVLIRDGDAQRNTFSTTEDYLAKGRAAAAGDPWYCELGPELSRGFRALSVWFTIKEHGLQRLGENITRNCRQANFLHYLVNHHPNLELLAPVSLNIICFRYRMPAMSDKELNSMNRELIVLLQESGIAVASQTKIRDKIAIRVNITNHRTRSKDMRTLVSAIDALAPQALSRVVEAVPQSTDTRRQEQSA
jgi:glutamate/tyrosine decarboxylase-like PLP-dependent enzyme